MTKSSSPTQLAFWLPLMVLCFAQFIASADNITLSIATRALMLDLGASMTQVSTANTMYPLVAGTFMIAGGMLGSIIGWRRTFRFGCVIYFLAELCATFSPSINIFIWVARILAGIGGSFMIPSVLGLITGLYRGRLQAIAFGALGAASGISFALGPIACGALLDTLGWRWAFGVMAALLILIFVFSLFIKEPEQSGPPARFDIPGFILATVGLFFVIFGVLQISTWGLLTPFNPPFTLFSLSPALFLVAAGLVVLWVMLRWEQRREDRIGSALVPRAFLHRSQVRAGLYLTAYIFFAYSSGIFAVVSFSQVVIGLSAVETGGLIVPFALCLASCSLGLPAMIHQRNPRKECRIGLSSGIVGALVTAAGIHEQGLNLPLIMIGLCFIGASMGIIAANAPFLVTSGLPEKEARQSGGIQAATRDIGQALGIAMVSMVMLTTLTLSMKNQSQTLPVSPQTRHAVQTMTVVPYVDNLSFNALMIKVGVDTHDLPTLKQAYRESRVKVTRAGLLSMAVMTLLFLAGTKNIPLTSYKNENQN